MDVARYHLPRRRVSAVPILCNRNLPRFAIIADVHDNRETVHVADVSAVQQHACTASAAFLILGCAERQVEHLRRHRRKIDAPILAAASQVIIEFTRETHHAFLLLVEIIRDQMRRRLQE
jgi:hypothetical protein